MVNSAEKIALGFWKEQLLPKRIFITFLSGLLLITACGFQPIRAQSPQNAEQTEAIRAQVNKLGTGKKSRVQVKLRDQTRLKGYIADLSTDSFTVIDSKGTSRTLAYTDVAEIKKQRGGISPLTWGIIAGAGVATAIVFATVIKPVICDGGAGC
jgi:hypothetical protein